MAADDLKLAQTKAAIFQKLLAIFGPCEKASHFGGSDASGDAFSSADSHRTSQTRGAMSQSGWTADVRAWM